MTQIDPKFSEARDDKWESGGLPESQEATRGAKRDGREPGRRSEKLRRRLLLLLENPKRGWSGRKSERVRRRPQIW